MTKQLGYSAVRAGAGLLPMMGTFALTSFVSGTLYARLGAKLIITIGAICLAAGMYLLSRLTADTSWLGLVPGMVVLGIGVGLFYSSITTVAITALDPSRSSLAGAIVYMFQIAGGAIGLGLRSAWSASFTRSLRALPRNSRCCSSSKICIGAIRRRCASWITSRGIVEWRASSGLEASASRR
jgi:MFS family permease